MSEILSKSMSKQSEMNLDRWRTRMISELGEEGFQSYNRSMYEKSSIIYRLIRGDYEDMFSSRSYATRKYVQEAYPQVSEWCPRERFGN